MNICFNLDDYFDTSTLPVLPEGSNIRLINSVIIKDRYGNIIFTSVNKHRPRKNRNKKRKNKNNIDK